MKTLNFYRLLALFVFSAAVFIYSCTSMRSTQKQAGASILATKVATPGNGMISFAQDGSKVEMKLELNFPSKAGQSLAVHLHEHGDCGNEGNAAGGHWNPTRTNHGKWGEGQFHLGDIGNIRLDASGKGTLTLKTSLWTVGTGGTNDVVGKAILVHEKADDFTTQPTGNAGGRIGCGVIQVNKM